MVPHAPEVYACPFVTIAWGVMLNGRRARIQHDPRPYGRGYLVAFEDRRYDDIWIGGEDFHRTAAASAWAHYNRLLGT